MAMYNLIEYSDNYSKTSGSLWQYYRDEPCINNDGVVIDIPNDRDSASFKSKQKITGQTENDGKKDVQIMVSLKYLTDFWRTLEIPLINCEIFFNFEECIIVTGNYDHQKPNFAITDTKVCVFQL